MLTVSAIVTLLSSQSWNTLLCFGMAFLLGMQLVTVLWVSHSARITATQPLQANHPETKQLETNHPETNHSKTNHSETEPPSTIGPQDQKSLTILVNDELKNEVKDEMEDKQQAELDNLRWRHDLAYDSYDGLGQSLTALNIQLQTALKLWETNPVQAQAFLVIAYEQGLAAMQEVRRTISMIQVETGRGDRSPVSPMNK